MPYKQCDCTCATKCPQGKVGSEFKCWIFYEEEKMGMEEDRSDVSLSKYTTMYDGPLTKKMEELGQNKEGGAIRYDKGKIQYELLPPEWIHALADVMTQGARKYEKRNWEKGMDWSAMIGSAQRHLNKFLAGSRYDGNRFDVSEGTTGCHHLAMAAWNLLALMTFDLRDIGEDDLPNLIGEVGENY